MSVGKNIRKYRKEKGLTQKELGQHTGIAEPNIRKYELEKQNPKIETLKKIADALDCSVIPLLGDEYEDHYLDNKNENFRSRTLNKLRNLNTKIEHLGFSLEEIPDEEALWINYQDGKLKVSTHELTALDKEIDSFILFKLNKLKDDHRKDFLANPAPKI